MIGMELDAAASVFLEANAEYVRLLTLALKLKGDGARPQESVSMDRIRDAQRQRDDAELMMLAAWNRHDLEAGADAAPAD